MMTKIPKAKPAKKLQDKLENKIIHSQGLVTKLRQEHNFSLSLVAIMDAIPMTFDIKEFKTVLVKTIGHEQIPFYGCVDVQKI